jgi:hypothetical protein
MINWQGVRFMPDPEPDIYDVLVRLQSAQRALMYANGIARELTSRPAVSERIKEIKDQLDSLIEGIR